MQVYDFIGHDYNSYEEMKEQFKIRIPENFNFAYDIVDRYAAEEPDRQALVWCDDSGASRVFTFAALSEAVNRTANYLRSFGVKKGDSVMLILRRRYEFWFFILALHKIGAVAVPATNMLLRKDLEYRNNAAGISMIVSIDDPVLQEQIEASLPASPTVKTLVTVGRDRPGWQSFHSVFDTLSDEFTRPEGKDSAGNKDIMLLYFTSGTSGEPKMVQHDFTYPLGHIVTAKYWQNVRDGGLHLTIAETGWAKAVWGKIYGQWISGCAVFAYDMDSFVPGKLLEKISEFGVTSFCAPPTVYRYLIKQDLTKYDLSKLEYCTTAGEALNPEVYNKFFEMTGLSLREGYGQTELTLTIGNFPWMDPKPGSMGKPAPGYDIDIIRPDGTSCDTDEVGEIVIRLEKGKPFGMFAGYYHDPALTEEAFEGGLYHTGDTASRDKEGFFWFVGRNDDLIKSSGYRISPFEVESTILTHPSVLECAVTGIADKNRNQIVKATIVLVQGYAPSRELRREIQQHVKEATASYKYPRVVEFVDELPKTISGKIRRVAIRESDSRNKTEV
ncbi:AMP-binding protein [Brucepastera parasyntrophica]|nr:AMP-binding protein [Brucepastera parasyntrophica]ULQ61200.1 AMP-binding protein [Brucepastera parasyntrophica]